MLVCLYSYSYLNVLIFYVKYLLKNPTKIGGVNTQKLCVFILLLGHKGIYLEYTYDNPRLFQYKNKQDALEYRHLPILSFEHTPGDPVGTTGCSVPIMTTSSFTLKSGLMYSIGILQKNKSLGVSGVLGVLGVLAIFQQTSTSTLGRPLITSLSSVTTPLCTLRNI